MHTRSQWLSTPLRVSLVYVLAGGLWVVLSDQLISLLNLSSAITIHSTKGLFYVLVTSVLFYFWLKRLKKALTESEERYRILVEHLPEPIVVHSEGKVVYINPAGASVFGAQHPEDMIGRSIIDFVHPDNLEWAREKLRLLIQTGKPSNTYEQSYLRIDGQMIDVEARAVPITYLGKPAVQLLCKDITERKRAQRRLEESEQSYKSLVEHNPDAILSLDLNGQMLGINSAAERITGYSKEELQRQSFLRFIHGTDREKALYQFEQAAGGVSNNIEVTLTHKQGESVIVNLKMVPIIVDGKIEGVFGIAKDITEHKRTAELLLKSEKLSIVGQLAAGVAHEIRNPLTSLKGFVQLLQMKTGGFREYFEIMLSELDRINCIVSEFMVIAKPQVVQFEIKDLRKILQDVIALLDTQAILNNVQIHSEIDEDIPLIHCEENQLKQVFINILKNAIEAMPEGGDVVVQMKADEGSIDIRFVDQGCGISEERLALLGEPFYTTKEKGTGLGLMVSHKIIEGHQGKLQVQSQIDVGTTVHLHLPILQPHSLHPSKPVAT
ncbi:PAS domain-containing sensor histidine kinase [Paenibacillus cremeus]|nr:PAS domain-containing sensor histidine kinase [Paenibacillus cremeus]